MGGTFAVDLDPLSLLTRLCAAVPPPRFHTVRSAGVLASMTEQKELRRYLQALSEATKPPERSPARGPPYWRSRALRRRAGEVDAGEVDAA
jgi:hypothetical protein